MGVLAARRRALVYRSTFLPRPLGILMMLSGMGWLTFLWPPLAVALGPLVLGLGVLAEGALMLWLLVEGVDASRWREDATAQPAGGG